MWTKKILSMLLIWLTLLSLLASCATPGDKTTTPPPDHKPPPAGSGGAGSGGP
jgi:hypothetical protein